MAAADKNNEEAMATANISPLPPQVAGKILRSVRTRDANALESALVNTGQVRLEPAPADLDERLELMEAIAEEMRTAVRRAQGEVRFEGFDAYVPLLKNLAKQRPS